VAIVMHDTAKPGADAARLARELEEMRRELMAERTRFADFASIASDWWWEMSADLRLTYVSDRFAKLFNRKVEEVLGKPRRDMAQASPSDPKWIEHKALLAARKPFRNFETTLVDGAGVTRRIVTSGLPIFDAAGQYVGYRGVGIDVTDIRRHQDEVAERTRVLEATLENLEEGVGLIDKNLRAIAFNRRLLDHLRLPQGAISPGDPFEKILRLLAAAGEYGDEEPDAAVARRLALALSGKPMVAERTTPTGRILEIRTNPMPDGGFVIRYNDVTEARKRDAAIHQAQKMEALGQLTGGIAHDFNNLLTVVMGSAELLRETGDPTRQQELAATIMRAAERGSELAKRLLAFARRQPLAPKTIDVNHLVGGMQGLLAQTLGEHIEIRVAAGAKLLPAHVDAGQLETAILNLAINARDAMQVGGRLTIETRNVHLDPGFLAGTGDPPPGDYVLVAVSDTGMGMTPEVKARAFDPFFTTKDFGKGSGLGLSMVYGFVRQSGGYITLYSEPGLGTTVKLYFPPAEGAPASEEGLPVAAEDPRGSETVLLVEDDAMVRRHVEALITALGYRTVVAENGAAALAFLGSGEGVDLVFTDVVMPGGMSGRDLADAARRLRPGIKILFTSGYTNEMFAASAPEAEQLANFIAKPYRRRDLAAKLRAVLDA
jgi:signal transduction histidine kinase/ActR/RegA family two-component response regulator